MPSNFTKDTAIELFHLQKSIPYPVDFNAAIDWLDYARKDVAQAAFLKCGFSEGIDYQSVTSRTVAGGTPRQDIKLTIDCFKMWGMMAGTEKGKEIRRYFLECEKIAIAASNNPQPLPDRYPEVAARSVAESIATVQQLVAPISAKASIKARLGSYSLVSSANLVATHAENL